MSNSLPSSIPFHQVAQEVRNSMYQELGTTWLILYPPHGLTGYPVFVAFKAFFRSVPVELKMGGSFGVSVMGEETQLSVRMVDVGDLTDFKDWMLEALSLDRKLIRARVSAVLVDESLGVISLATTKQERGELVNTGRLT